MGSAAEAYGCQTFDPGKGRFFSGDFSPGSIVPPVGVLALGTEIEVGGLISEDTTWDAEVVRVMAAVEVAKGVSLTIAPGTRVEFAGYFKLLVHGRLWAVGEPDSRIQFTSEAGQESEGWDGLEFLNVPADEDYSRVEHCDFSYAVARPLAGRSSSRIEGGTARPETGGAISIVGVNKLVITSCIFSHNSADYGGAIYCGYGSSPILVGNLFHDNTATLFGSVLFNVYAYPKLLNNTLVENECLAESMYQLCGAVDNFNGKIVLLGNIIRDNFTNHYSGTQMLASKDYYIHANNIEAYVGNDTNLDIAPEFLAVGEFPYQLADTSPCLDAGVDDQLLKLSAEKDIAGSDRVCGVQIDMGAFEHCSSTSFVPPSSTLQLKLTSSCSPNPFNPSTIIEFNLPVDSYVELKVFDLKGRLLRILVNEHHTAGKHEVQWDGRNSRNHSLASGTYLYQLSSGGDVVVRSMTLVR